MAIIGYVRTYKEGETTDAQRSVLNRAGCDEIHEEAFATENGNERNLQSLIGRMSRGDMLVVVRLDRLSRSLAEQLTLIDDIISRGGNFSSLREMIDTTSTSGKRRLHAFRMKAGPAGILTAQERERDYRKPGLRVQSPRTLLQHAPVLPVASLPSKARHEKYTQAISGKEEDWVPHVRRLRPHMSWDNVISAINSGNPEGGPWTNIRLQRAVRTYVAYGYLPQSVLDPPKGRTVDPRLPDLVWAMKMAEPDIKFSEIAKRLEAMGELTPRGRKTWSHKSVVSLFNRAKRMRRGYEQ